MKLDRLLSIVIMLLNRDRVQAGDLAEHFGVSVRTIYRDIDAINRAGIPIVTYQGNKGGLGIIDGYTLDRQVLTLQDMVSMLSVLKGVNSTFQDRQIHDAIEKIHSLVPEEKQDYVRNHADRVVIDVMPWGMPGRQKEKMVLLQQAIAENYLVDFSYCDCTGARSRRTIEPMTLLFKATTWYVFAYCRLRSDFRLFRLSRMRRLVVLKTTFIRKNSDYNQYDQMSSGAAKMVQLVINFKKSIAQNVEDYVDESCLKYMENGDIIATVEMPENDWIISWLLSLGEHVEVIKPERMRTLLQEKARKIIGIYRNSQED